MTPEAAYQELRRRAREEALLASCADLLEWDEETYMPRGGVAHRSDQQALLAGLMHERGTDPRWGELLDLLEASPLAADPGAPAAVNVRWLRREYERERRLPRALVEEDARVTTLALEAWAEAREDDDFARFLPWLERLVVLARETAAAVGYAESPYDALLDEYEPGLTVRRLEPLFASLRAELVPLVRRIGEAPRRPPAHLLHREFPVDRQKLFGEAAAAWLGFDVERGRLDVSAHPFCTAIGPGDVRLTSRYDAHDFAEGFLCVLHEVGHGLYEQGLDPEEFGLPMGEAVSLGVHESQSRLWENFVGRSLAFWEHVFPRAQAVFHDALRDVPLDAFHFALNAVAPGPNRVRADEVTYNLHVLVRFELERALIEGTLAPADVPAAWRDAYREVLGVDPGNDAEGCLQDSHWAAGLFGYFPTYTLGNVYAAQFVAAARRDLGDLESGWRRGQFAPLLGWLRDRIHRQGHRWRPDELVERVTGAPPDHGPLVQYLAAKYEALYEL